MKFVFVWLFLICVMDFEVVFENTPCAMRRGGRGFPEASLSSFGGSTVVRRKFKSHWQANAGHIRPEKAEQTLCLLCLFLFEFHDTELRKCHSICLFCALPNCEKQPKQRRKTKFVSLGRSHARYFVASLLTLDQKSIEKRCFSMLFCTLFNFVISIILRQQKSIISMRFYCPPTPTRGVGGGGVS